METKQIILEGKTSLGVEFGSTRIKAVLIDEKGTPLASGSYEWENQYVDGIWTYDLDRQRLFVHAFHTTKSNHAYDSHKQDCL